MVSPVILNILRYCVFIHNISIFGPFSYQIMIFIRTSCTFSFQAKEKMQVKVMLDARTQLGYMPKTKAENIKSFGDILNQILESNARLRDRI